MAQRTYEVGEANRLLPQVRRLVGQIVELTTQIPELQDQARIAEYRKQRVTATAADSDRFEQAATALHGAEDDLVVAMQTLERLGAQLKDPRIGLVDFLSYRNGELIELCWQLGEDQVAHWHRIGEGYAGRRPI